MDSNALERRTKWALSLVKQKRFAAAIVELTELADALGCCSHDEIVQARVEQGLTATPSAGGMYHPKLVSLLDYRFKVYVRVGETEKAFADAKRIVKLQPFGAKGYLRCGQVLQVKGDFEKAYKVYNKGLQEIERVKEQENISVSESLLVQLKEQREVVMQKIKAAAGKKRAVLGPVTNSKKPKLRKQQTAVLLSRFTLAHSSPQFKNPVLAEVRRTITRSTDPLLHLPVEIIMHIFKHIPTYEIIKSHFLVSKEWYKTLSRVPDFYQTFNFSQPLTSRVFSNFMTFLEHCKRHSFSKKIQTLAVNKIMSTNERYIMRKIAQSGFNLQIRSLALNLFELDLFQLIEVLENSEEVETLCALKKFKLSAATTPFLEEKLLQLLPGLQTLHFILTNGHSNESDMSIRLKKGYENKVIGFHKQSELVQYLQCYTQVERLTLVGQIKMSYSNLKVPFYNVFKYRRVPNLKNLNITGFDFTKIVKEAEELRKQEDSERRHLRQRVARGEENASEVAIGDCVLRSLFQLPLLHSLWLEGNKGLMFEAFLHHRSVNESLTSDKLNSLVLRERISAENAQDNRRSLWQMEHLINGKFNNLTELDLYNTSLSNVGVMKVLEAVGGHLKILNIGAARNVVYPYSPFQANVHPENEAVFQFEPFLKAAPNLSKLCIADGKNLNDYTLKVFKDSLVSVRSEEGFEGTFGQLKCLDLSFTDISGYGLMEFFNYKAKERQGQVQSLMASKVRSRRGTLERSRSESRVQRSLSQSQGDQNGSRENSVTGLETRRPRIFNLDMLVCDGIENISSMTVDMLVKEGYVGAITNDLSRQKWQQFGKNSYLV